jgi:succinate dehydrogenase / fumarate reductase flavoprotein subunit
MMKALNRLQGVRADALSRLAIKGRSPRYCYELVEAFEIENMLDCAEMMVRASLMRKESRRHMFIREDYPSRDDANWLKHIVIHRSGGGMDLQAVPVDLKYLRPDESGVRPAR